MTDRSKDGGCKERGGKILGQKRRDCQRQIEYVCSTISLASAEHGEITEGIGQQLDNSALHKAPEQRS